MKYMHCARDENRGETHWGSYHATSVSMFLRVSGPSPSLWIVSVACASFPRDTVALSRSWSTLIIGVRVVVVGERCEG